MAPKLAQASKRVFVDLKLHDIPYGRARDGADRAVGGDLLTVHAYPQTMRAAAAGAKGTSLKLLAVSVLTSSDDADLAEAGYAYGVSALVNGARARRSRRGSTASSAALPRRRRSGPSSAGRCCWSRPACDRPARRSATRSASRRRRRRSPTGADYLVVGRPITQDPDPRAAADRIVAEIAAAGGWSRPLPRLPSMVRTSSGAMRKSPMPKGYVVPRVDILDPEAYAKYAAAATKAIAAPAARRCPPKPQNPKTPKPLQNFLHFNIYSLKLIRK